MDKRSYKVVTDADWRVVSAEYAGEVTDRTLRHRSYPYLYRNDVPESNELWGAEYQNSSSMVWNIPVELHLLANDELDAFVKAQAWLDERKPD